MCGSVMRLALLSLGLSVIPGFAPAASDQQIFATPEAAVDALVSASRDTHLGELRHILGPKSKPLVSSGDTVADAEGRQRFLQAYDAAHKLETRDDGAVVLEVGDDLWPMPIPLVKSGSGYRFDTEAGQLEILNRRIGRDELSVIEVCRTFVEAQRDFASLHTTAEHQHSYATKFLSSPGQHDGLYWPVKDGETESPLGPLIADASMEGYKKSAGHEGHMPYHGYYYRILAGQGPDAPGGAESYISNDQMTKGFALVAYPASYGNSGIMSFIVNQDGIVYEKNLGPMTLSIVTDITLYNPDNSWKVLP